MFDCAEQWFKKVNSLNKDLVNYADCPKKMGPRHIFKIVFKESTFKLELTIDNTNL